MECTCTNCKLEGLERVRYFSRQLITADDMTAEQQYFRQKMRRHNRFAHGWGVVCGSEVKAAPDEARPWRVRVCPGYVLAPQGDEIVIGDGVYVDLATGAAEPEDVCAPWPCPPTGRMPGAEGPRLAYLAIRYAECDARPLRVRGAGCGCDDTGCEYSRTRDSFELKLLWEIPQSHVKAAAVDAAWAEAVRDPESRRILPTPPCPECPSEPWVVLARIMLPPQRETALTQGNINYLGRRVLLSTTALQVMMLNIP